eukprot:352218-Chlamydomonas_euryale.AAC.2
MANGATDQQQTDSNANRACAGQQQQQQQHQEHQQQQQQQRLVWQLFWQPCLLCATRWAAAKLACFSIASVNTGAGVYVPMPPVMGPTSPS